MKLALAVVLSLAAIVVTVAKGATPPLDFWKHNTKTYRCAGVKDFVVCHSTLKEGQGNNVYRMSIDKNVLWVAYAGRLRFTCDLRQLPTECKDVP